MCFRRNRACGARDKNRRLFLLTLRILDFDYISSILFVMFFSIKKCTVLHTSIACIFFAAASLLPAQIQEITPPVPPAVRAVVNAYKNEQLQAGYDIERRDWVIRVPTADGAALFYWAGGRLLPEELLDEADSYRTLVYPYPTEIPDPANFTQEDIARYSRSGDTENRRNAPLQYPGFLDAIYDSATQASIEEHIQTVLFLGKYVTVHEKIVEPLERVEEKIAQRARTDAETAEFVETLSRTDGYLWREIRDTGSRSFHSYALAIDVLPEGWGREIVYWNWEKNKGNDEWMLIPLEDRWIPPLAVISIFESEGFIWGGKWGIWDNMHFEYRPELILLQQYSRQQS